MKKSTKVFLWVIGVVLAGSVLIAILIFAGGTEESEYDLSGHGAKVAVVNLTGTIISSREIVSTLQTLAENKSVKAILLRVDSPGGGVAASQEIFEEVESIRDSVKPIVVSMGSLAASGGYYVSCGATRIVANPGTITGSIGVIAMFPNYAKLMEKLGLQMDVIKSGKYKDSGSPFRQMTEQDKKYFQGVVEDSYDQFLNAVAKERKLPIDNLKKFADGRVFTGAQALKLGLVDTLGSFEDAIKIAAKLGGIKGEPVVVEAKKPRTLADLIFGDMFSRLHIFEKDFIEQPILQYRFSQ
ncbi:MAG: signal peptide peptidase SppA [Bacteroidetes bacterium]|nr:signal peptide peptidase SppA [Bacteroidota bacterium]MCL5738767.1 signal peptide peptidase SppA [Bacteroidota bacterium]